MIGLGLIKNQEGDTSIIIDIVPCDYVADTVIVSAAKFANTKEFTVIHASSSTRNPECLGKCYDLSTDFWKTFPLSKKIGTPSFSLIYDQRIYQVILLCFFIN